MKTRIPIEGEQDVARSIRNIQASTSRHQRMFKHQHRKTGASRLGDSLELGAWNLDVRSSRAFTLIEILVVIAIIVVLAALLIPAGAAVANKAVIQRAQSERNQIETALDAYKAKYGFYPPSNAAGMPLTNQLYYELLGTTMSVGNNNISNFTTLDNASLISGTTISGTYFVSAFMNCTKPGGAEDSIPASTFLPGLKPGEIASNGPTTFLVTAANSDLSYKPMPGVYSLVGRPANPWRYVCPGTNNPNSYDLWVQVFVGNKSNLICNWSKNPQINVPLP